MPQLELLNNVKHQDLRIDTHKKAEYGDNVGGCLVFPAEFMEVHKEYPIYFQKDAETGEYQALALFGFDNGENLFLSETGWQADYVPALIRREPFLIGLPQEAQDTDLQNAVIHVDMESPRIATNGQGEAVFLAEGGASPFLKDINAALALVHEGLNNSKAMFEGFAALDLIEPFTLDIVFDDQSQFKTSRYYTINQEKLYQLPDNIVGELHRAGYLQLAYMVLQSLGNVKKLIKKKNAAHQQ